MGPTSSLLFFVTSSPAATPRLLPYLFLLHPSPKRTTFYIARTLTPHSHLRPARLLAGLTPLLPPLRSVFYSRPRCPASSGSQSNSIHAAMLIDGAFLGLHLHVLQFQRSFYFLLDRSEALSGPSAATAAIGSDTSVPDPRKNRSSWCSVFRFLQADANV